MRNSCIIFLTMLSILAANAQTVADSSPAYTVNGKAIAVKLSADGEIVGATAGSRQINVSGRTSLDGCTQVGAAKAEQLSDRAVEFTRTLRDSASGRTLTVVDRFKPGEDDSVRWEIEVASDGEPWTTPITTELNYPATSATRFWTAWSDPDQMNGEWRDPLVLRPLASTSWAYGGSDTSTHLTVLPLATVAEPAGDFGLSLVFSPEDTILCGSRLTDDTVGRDSVFAPQLPSRRRQTRSFGDESNHPRGGLARRAAVDDRALSPIFRAAQSARRCHGRLWRVFGRRRPD